MISYILCHNVLLVRGGWCVLLMVLCMVCLWVGWCMWWWGGVFWGWCFVLGYRVA